MDENLLVLSKEDLVEAKKKLRATYGSPTFGLEVAKVLGEPIDPRKPYPSVISAVADISVAEVGEDVFYFDTDEDTKYVYVIDANGNVIQSQVTPASTNTATFSDTITPEFYIPLSSILSAKYDVLARKKVTVTRALDAYEIYKVLLLLWDGTPVGNQFSLGSGTTKFTYPKLVDMVESVEDYGDNYVLICGSVVNKDIRLWSYDKNRYGNVNDILKDLKVETIKVTGTVTVDGTSRSLLASTDAILVARNTELNIKPVQFCRRSLNPVEIIGGNIDRELQRAIIVSPALLNVGTNRKPALSATGFESISSVLVNTKAVSRFRRE